MTKISALPEDTSPTTDDFGTSLDNLSNSTKKVRWLNILSLTVVTPQMVAPVNSVTSATTITPVTTSRMTVITALANDAAVAAPTGTTPADGQALTIRIKDNGSARALSFNVIYRAVGVTLPSTTVASKNMYLSFSYNTPDATWDLLAVARQ